MAEASSISKMKAELEDKQKWKTVSKKLENKHNQLKDLLLKNGIIDHDEALFVENIVADDMKIGHMMKLLRGKQKSKDVIDVLMRNGFPELCKEVREPDMLGTLEKKTHVERNELHGDMSDEFNEAMELIWLEKQGKWEEQEKKWRDQEEKWKAEEIQWKAGKQEWEEEKQEWREREIKWDARMTKWDEICTKLGKEKDELKNENDELKNENDELKNENDEMKNENDEMKTTMAEIEKKYKRAQEQVVELTRVEAELNRNNIIIQNQLKNANAKIQQVLKKDADKSSQIESFKKDISKLERDKDKEVNYIIELRNDLANARKKVIQLRDQLKKTEVKPNVTVLDLKGKSSRTVRYPRTINKHRILPTMESQKK